MLCLWPGGGRGKGVRDRPRHHNVAGVVGDEGGVEWKVVVYLCYSLNLPETCFEQSIIIFASVAASNSFYPDNAERSRVFFYPRKMRFYLAEDRRR